MHAGGFSALGPHSRSNLMRVNRRRGARGGSTTKTSCHGVSKHVSNFPQLKALLMGMMGPVTNHSDLDFDVGFGMRFDFGAP